jgi:hypothetical protein
MEQVELELEIRGYAEPAEMLPRSVRQQMREDFLALPETSLRPARQLEPLDARRLSGI